MTMRVAIYARVSTDDKGQTTENQLRELREWCRVSGHEIVATYSEHESGRGGADKRPQLAAMLDAAGKRKFDLVLVWALDRLSREGMMETMQHLAKLDTFGVRFHSYCEPMLSTDNELVRNVMLALYSSIAKQETEKLSRRVKAGMARAKAKGTRSGKAIGRPGNDPATAAKARQLLSDGVGICKTSRLTGLGNSTVQKLKAELATA